MNTIICSEKAKLLKAKGFDKQCLNFYTNPKCKMFGIDEYGRYYPIKNKSNKLWTNGEAATLDSRHVYYAPTIAEVVMWLYEKHGIWISVFKYKDHAADVNDPWLFRNQFDRGGYSSPTEAYEAGIKYSLNNLIK